MKALKWDQLASGVVKLPEERRNSVMVLLSSIAIACAVAAFLFLSNVPASAEPVESWSHVNEGGFGDSTNLYAPASVVYDDLAYFGTAKEGGGCEVWRYDGTTWSQVNEDGFGDAQNTGIYSMAVYGLDLYAGTNHPGSPGGCEVWRYDGTTWSQVNEDGFGDSHNQIARSMVVYEGKLYVGTFNIGGCEVWRYDGGGWLQVNSNGFGDAKNLISSSMSVFDNRLFVGTYNNDGCQIWSYDGAGWSHEGIDGFGDVDNDGAESMTLNDGCLYVGTLNRGSGCELWSYDAVAWTPVIEGGFGDPGNTAISSLGALGGSLLAGTGMGSGHACEMWQLIEGAWCQVGSDGFGDAGNDRAYSMLAYGSSIFIGTGNEVNGCEVWRGSSQYSFYFAEGYTGQGVFDEYICLMNPNETDTTARVTYMFTDGSTQDQDVPVKATSRATVNVNSVVGPDREVSIMVTSPGTIVAERPMYFNYNGAWTGGHDVMGAQYPYTSWYFAEGYTGQGVFDEYICLMNPNETDTTARVTYMFTDGSTQDQDVPVKATSRATVNVNSVVGPDKEVSIRVTSLSPIVAERPMYFNYNGAWTGGHDVMGAFSPGRESYFAEGYTGQGNFDEYLCLMNPNPEAILVIVTFLHKDGSKEVLNVKMEGTTRTTVNVNSAVGPDKEVSISVTSLSPIVAERPMYFNYNGAWTGGHDVIGAGAPKNGFLFAEGYTGQGVFDEYICLMNPNETDTTARVTYMFTDGSTQDQDVPVKATSRATVNVNSVVGPDREVSIMVTSPGTIVAERPMYFNYNGAWTGGHDVIGFQP